MSRIRIRCRAPERTRDPKYGILCGYPASLADTEVFLIQDDGSEVPITNLAGVTWKVGGAEAATAQLVFDAVDVDIDADAEVDIDDIGRAVLGAPSVKP